MQTQPLADGREVSPHDPLLPLLLAPGVAVGGWLGASSCSRSRGRVVLLLTWTAWRPVSGVAPATAAVVVGACAVSAPLVSYGTQVYPELPARSPSPPRWRCSPATCGARDSSSASPWRSSCSRGCRSVCAGLVAALAVPGLWRIAAVRGRGSALAVVGALAGAAAVFAAVHLAVYDGLTPMPW